MLLICSEKGIVGKKITPYILQRVNELTSGGSLNANIALVKNNAIVGAQIAKRLADMYKYSRLLLRLIVAMSCKLQLSLPAHHSYHATFFLLYSQVGRTR